MMTQDSRKRPTQGTNVTILFSYLSSQKKRKKPDGGHWNPRILEKDLQDDELGLPFKVNIIRHNISYNFAFGPSIYHISQDFA